MPMTFTLHMCKSGDFSILLNIRIIQCILLNCYCSNAENTAEFPLKPSNHKDLFSFKTPYDIWGEVGDFDEFQSAIIFVSRKKFEFFKSKKKTHFIPNSFRTKHNNSILFEWMNINIFQNIRNCCSCYKWRLMKQLLRMRRKSSATYEFYW